MPVSKNKEWDLGYGITIKISKNFLDRVWTEFSSKHSRQKIDRDKAELCMAKLFNLIILYLKEGIPMYNHYLGCFSTRIRKEKRIKTKKGFTRILYDWKIPKLTFTKPSRRLYLKEWNKKNESYQIKSEQIKEFTMERIAMMLEMRQK